MKALKMTLALGTILGVMVLVACGKSGSGGGGGAPAPVAIPQGNIANLSCVNPAVALNQTELFYQQEDVLNNARCSTGPQQSSTLQDFCQRLLNDQMNNSCARAQREALYSQRCGVCVMGSNVALQPLGSHGSSVGMTAQQVTKITCTVSASDFSGRSLSPLDTSIAAFPLLWDTQKAETYPIPHRYIGMLGNISLKTQPVVNGAGGTLELQLTNKLGGVTSLMAELDSHLKMEVEDTHREINVTVECSVDELMAGGDPKAFYTCSSSGTGAAAAAGFKAKDKAKSFVETSTQALKLEADADKERIVLTDLRKTQKRLVKTSVPFGRNFIVRTSAGGGAGASEVQCSSTANAAQ